MTADQLVALLARLDALLAGAVARAASELGSPADAFRGLYLRPDELARELARRPLESALAAAREAGAPVPELASLGLDGFDSDVVLLALAPELDLRYGRVYAYLQDDVGRRLPSPGLALDLLCATAEERVARRARFAEDGRLRRRRVLSLRPQGGDAEPVAGQGLVVEERIVSLLLGAPYADSRVRYVPTAPGPGAKLAARLWEGEVLHVAGARSDCAAAAAELAHALGRPLVAAETTGGELADGLVALLDREALLAGAVALLEGVDLLDEAACVGARRAVAGAASPFVVAGERLALHRSGEAAARLAPPDGIERARLWRAAGLGLPGRAVDELADRFRLGRDAIVAAAAEAKDAARARSAAGRPTVREVTAVAQAHAAPRLDALARRIHPAFGWDDLVVPDDAGQQLRELCARVRDRRRVHREWGFGRKLARTRGVTALFAGPSGTGKTMAAEVVAGELGLELYRIDLAGVVSKYIGETEKNLDRLFEAAEAGSVVLLFDEADALFGKRSEVRDAHDRYANLEIAYLLQRMDAYDGVALLTSNLAGNVEEAFARRLAFSIHFPFPEVDDRRRIWRGVWPPETPLGDDVDLDLLARELRLAGGGIRNAALAAAFEAASDGGVVRMEHVLHGARREFQKLGRQADLTLLGSAA